jgi:hypothetical protein
VFKNKFNNALIKGIFLAKGIKSEDLDSVMSYSQQLSAGKVDKSLEMLLKQILPYSPEETKKTLPDAQQDRINQRAQIQAMQEKMLKLNSEKLDIFNANKTGKSLEQQIEELIQLIKQSEATKTSGDISTLIKGGDNIKYGDNISTIRMASFADSNITRFSTGIG